MRAAKLGVMACAVLGAATWAAAGEGERDDVAVFAEPVRIQAGDGLLGEGRYYPSPVLHDLDGDGTPELLVADLRGLITFAKRTESGWGAEQPLNGADGKPLKFHNW
ncbi:MAG: hypothetical protein ACYTGX_09315 [Planctomycetota bacterium]